MSLFTKKKSNIPMRRSAGRNVHSVSTSDIFRRNRTLTGTTSNNLDSTDVRSDLESDRIHVHHLTNHRRKILSVFMVVFVSVILLWVLISNFTATVIVRVSDTNISKPVDSSRYEKAIQNYLDINPISRFNFLLDQSSLTKYISDNLPEVSGVSQQNMAGIGETNFVVTMRTPVAGWKINDKQYYVDSKGISFEQNYFLAPTVQIVDSSGASPQMGTAIVSNRFLGFVGRVVSAAKTSGYTVTQAVLPANTTRELEIHIKDNTTLVKLSIDRPAGEQIEDMANALKYCASHSISPSYIDVRVSGKAFYK